jgi:hypothetical protein
MKKILFNLCLIAALFSSCDREKQVNSETPLLLSSAQKEALDLLGFDSNTAKMMADGRILTNGDIAIDPKTLSALLAKQKEVKNDSIAGDRQRALGKTAMVDYSNTNGITFSISDEFSETEKTAIRAGFALWSTPFTSLVFVEVIPYSESADIKVYEDNYLVCDEHWWSGLCYGLGSFPNGHKPGPYIALNMDLIEDDCTVSLATCVRNVLAHELGHNLGFFHTDDASGILLVNSPVNDKTSIMNSGNVQSMADVGLSPGPNANDLNMASAIYPKNGLTMALTGVTIVEFPGWYELVGINYSQTFGRSYTAKVEIFQNEVLIKSFFQDIGLATSGSIYTPLKPGHYQARTFGKNYKGDFTQPNPSNTLDFTVP